MAVKNIVEVKPARTMILVEELTNRERLNAKIELTGTVSSKEPPQAYIVSMGPMVEDKFGFKVGDRVIITGNYVEAPKVANRSSDRRLLLIEPHCISAVLVEEGCEEECKGCCDTSCSDE